MKKRCGCLRKWIVAIFLYRGLRYRIFFDWDVEGRATSGRGNEYDIPREEIFVITKIYPNQFSYPEAAIEMALKKMDVGYIDMMLLHHPGTGDVAAYQAMEKSCSKPSDLTACRGYLLEA